MMRHLILKKLWLISEIERSACEIDLSAKKTLLLGTNGTGKSRVTKNIFWAFGCEPNKRNAGSFDPDTISIVEFEFNNETYQSLRLGKSQGMYKNDSFIFSSSNHAAWSDFTSKLFSFHLTGKRPNSNSFRPLGVDYLTVPFYIDQDGSWGVDWAPYSNLKQFSNWKPSLFSAFTGLRPNTYLESKQQRDETNNILKEKLNEIEAQKNAFKRVKEILPKNLPSLNLSAFRSELKELANKAKNVQRKQIDLRASLINTVNQRQQLESEIKLVVGSYKELMNDISFLSDIPESTNIECPTCGTKHQTSFHARLALSTDAESMSALVHELNKSLEDIRQKEASIKNQITFIEKEINEFNHITEEKKARLRLDEVLAAHSKITLEKAFLAATDNLYEKTSSLEIKLSKLNGILKSFENKERHKQVLDYYSSQLTFLSNNLNIPQEERVDETRLGARPESGGSSGPRAILAVHLALIATNLKFGDTLNFPFVVDTPQQSGQDEENLSKMISVMEHHSATNQLILAVERLPTGADVSNFKVINFVGKKQLMQKQHFDSIADIFKDKIRELKRKTSEEELKFVSVEEFTDINQDQL